jgi:iron complex transport system substrate-binding protein
LYRQHHAVRRRLSVLRPFIGLLSILSTLGCARPDTGADPRADTRGGPRVDTHSDTDDFGAPVPVDARYATRVVSLNPAATEAIFALGADSLLVGRSRWDEFPAAAARVPALGDGIRPNIEVVLAARPTLVVLYATAENRAAADALQRAGIRTVALRVDHIAQFHTLLRVLGRALGAERAATVVSDSVQHTLDRVRALTAARPRARVVWPVWESPVMVIGGGSYLDELLVIAGADNVFHDTDAPSPAVSIEEIARRDPDVVIAGETRAATLTGSPAWRAIRAVREHRMVVQDPAVTGRPSVVLGMAAVQLAAALHPDLRDSLPLKPR